MKMNKPDNTRQYRTIRTTAPTALLRASAITMVMLCAAAFVCGTAGAATIWVPEGGNQTIQQAVTNATAGDTIIVRDGTYRENVDVGKRLTIRSQNGSANCIVNASDSGDHVFDVQHDYVNISGFTVENATMWMMGTAGIYLGANVDHCNISDNGLTNNGYGIRLRSSSNNNTLTENTANSNTYGICMGNSCNNTLTSNTANSNGQCGIYLGDSCNNTLTSNTANSNGDRGIYLKSSSNNNTLTKNTANSNYYGIYLDSSSNNNTLTENTANSNGEDGIYLRDSSNNNTLTENTANSNTECGIYLDDSSNNTLTENTANSNGYYGIHINEADDNNVSCNWVQNNTAAGFYLCWGSTGNTIEKNNIIANGVLQGDGSYRWQFYNDQSDEVSTAYNWWGTNNETIINASIYDWTYDTDWGNVTTAPKLDGPAPCAPVPEAATVLLFAVGLLMLAGYVRAGRRKT